MPRLYKQKFFLALYDQNNNFVDLFDSCYDLAKKVGSPYKDIKDEVRRCIKLKGTFNFLGTKVQIHPIKANKKEREYEINN